MSSSRHIDEAAVPETVGTDGVGRGDPAPPPQKPGILGSLRVLRHREFAIFWVGHAVSQVGTWMQSFAQNWLVTDLTTSALALGWVQFAAALPTLLLMPSAGVLADRVERRRILLVSQWVLLILAAITGGLVGAHALELWHLYVIAGLLGVTMAYEMPAYQAFYPQLVDKEDLQQAISLNQATFHGGRIIGSAAAGLLVNALGLAVAFYANALSFLAVIASLMVIRPRPPAAPESGVSGRSMLGEGIRYVRERPAVMSLLLFTALSAFFIFPNLATLMAYYVKYELRLGARELGIVMAVSGGGSFLGSVLMLTVASEKRVGRMMLCVATILVTLSVLAHTRSLVVCVIATAIQSLAIAHSMGLTSVIIQELVPDQLRGRVMALYMMTFMGVIPFATVIVTYAVDLVGMRPELQISAVLYGVSGLALLWRLRSQASPPAIHTGDPAIH